MSGASRPRRPPRERVGHEAGLTTGPVVGSFALAGLAVFVIPVLGLVLRAPWGRLPELLATPSALAALRLSVGTSLAAVVVSTAVGVPLAWVLARLEFPGRGLVRVLVALPMVLPPVVGGLALLTTFGERGLAGPLLEAVGVSLPFTTAGVVAAQTFVAAPFLVVAVEAGFASADPRVEEAARSLGARRWLTWRGVVLPAVRRSLLAGIALCWARALGEFGATIAFAGSLEGVTRTLPLAVYQQLQTGLDGAVAMSLVLLGVSVVVIGGLRSRLAGGLA